MAKYIDENGLAHIWAKIKTLLGNKVDKVSGKGLSTNDYTTAEKTKLSGIAAGAEVNQNAYSTITVNGTDIKATSKTDTFDFESGENVEFGWDEINKGLRISATDTTYEDMKGATASAAGKNGLVPAPAAGSQSTKYLRADGTWQIPPDTKYTHPTSDGNKHVPATGTTNNGKFLMAGSTAGSLSWGTPADTKYNDFTGATASADGAHGLVPKPVKGSQGKFLGADGTWKNTITSFEITYGVGDALLMIETPDTRFDAGIKCANAETAGLMGAAEYVKLNALPTAATLNSTYAKKADIVGMYKYKGSVTDASKLPTTGQVTGDVYNIEAASAYGGAGMNVAWNGTAWDPLGEIFTITSLSNSEIDTICA